MLCGNSECCLLGRLQQFHASASVVRAVDFTALLLAKGRKTLVLKAVAVQVHTKEDARTKVAHWKWHLLQRFTTKMCECLLLLSAFTFAGVVAFSLSLWSFLKQQVSTLLFSLSLPFSLSLSLSLPLSHPLFSLSFLCLNLHDRTLAFCPLLATTASDW